MAKASLPTPSPPQMSCAWGMRPSATAERSMATAPSCPIISLKYTSFYLLIGLVRLVMYALYGHALHLDEPTRAANWSKEIYLGDGGETLGKHRLHHGIISNVPQIDDKVPYMLKSTLSLGQQRFHVFPHAFGLAAYIARIHDLTAIIDTGCTRYEDMAAVTIVNVGSTLETDTILIRCST